MDGVHYQTPIKLDRVFHQKYKRKINWYNGFRFVCQRLFGPTSLRHTRGFSNMASFQRVYFTDLLRSDGASNRSSYRDGDNFQVY